ncbi:MAG: hypothetical protein AAF798_17660 [Bacteroidota bacterium]
MTKFEPSQETRITEIKSFQQFLKNGVSLANCTLMGLDFSLLKVRWEMMNFENTTFLGCKLTPAEEEILHQRGAYIYKAPTTLPYRPFRSQLYTWQELAGTNPADEYHAPDFKIYQHFSKSKFTPSINEALWQRIHDYAIDEALRDLLHFDEQGMTKLKCVGFMGGHSTGRDDEWYLKTAQTAKLLAENGYYIVSGGGPGIMEATNVGAYFAGRSAQDLADAVDILAKAPKYDEASYQDQALEVLERYPDGGESLAIPTWFYGHEPSNLFATHIAKYFSNSIREDTLLAVSLYGIICAPGSAGTTQEIFMDATQNHYGTFNYYSPMVFLGRKRYEVETMIYPLLRQLAYGQDYFKQLFLTDEPKEILTFLRQHPPVKVK